MATNHKKRAVVSYEKMSAELQAAFAEKYPKGFSDYLPDIIKYDKPDGSCFYAVTMELSDAIYLVKIKIKTDNAEDIDKWLNEESEASEDTGNSAAAGDGETLPDDNISQYSSGDDDSAEA